MGSSVRCVGKRLGKGVPSVKMCGIVRGIAR